MHDHDHQDAPRLALVAHMRERIALGQLGTDTQLRAAAGSARLLRDLCEKKDPRAPRRCNKCTK